MTQRCSATNHTKICPQRHTCELYRKYLEADGGVVVSVESMPVSVADGCYKWKPVEIKTV